MIDRISRFFGIYDGPPAIKAFWSRINAPRAAHIKEIRLSIAKNGFWEQQIEWRISTTTISRIEPVEYDGNKWFHVKVECGHEFTCHCPTIERAAEFESIYRTLIGDMFYFRGWPSWASKDSLKAPEDITSRA